MSQKSVATLLLMLATVIGGPVAVDRAIDVQETIITSIAIEGPAEAQVGELVTLTVTGDRPSWLVEVADCYIDGSMCIVSFRENGEYEIIASSIAGRETRVVKHIVTVGPPPAPPVPVPDTPVPTPDVDTDKASELTESVYKWCVEANADKKVCHQLGDNFIDAATNSTTIDQLLKTVAESNRKVNQRTVTPVLVKIQEHLFQNLGGGTFDDHQCAFDEIGQGFLRYAGGKTGSIQRK